MTEPAPTPEKHRAQISSEPEPEGIEEELRTHPAFEQIEPTEWEEAGREGTDMPYMQREYWVRWEGDEYVRSANYPVKEDTEEYHESWRSTLDKSAKLKLIQDIRRGRTLEYYEALSEKKKAKL